MSLDLNDHLIAYLKKLYPARQDIRIRNLQELPAGWESDLYAFDLSYRNDGMSRSKALVLRVFPGDDARQKSRHEFNGMLLLHKLDYPVPRVYAVYSRPSPIGRSFLIMEHIQGEVMGTVIERSKPKQQSRLITRLSELFVRLHNLDWRPFVSDPARIESSGNFLFADIWIARVRRSLEAGEESGFLSLLNWIARQRAEMRTLKPSFVHRDFHPHNVIMHPDGTAVVIDWSGWQVTDFRFDLAWTLVLAYAYRGERVRRQILEAYEKTAGEPVENIEVFEVCACLRRLQGVTASLKQGAESQGMRPQAVGIMRSQIEQLQRVYELMNTYTGITIPEVAEILNNPETPTSVD